MSVYGFNPGRVAASALIARELRRFVRQPTRVAASIGTAALVWVFLASGFSRSFAMPGAAEGGVEYGAYLLPGVVTMLLMFSTVFSAISLIQDRQEGFLQSVLVSPAPAWVVPASKVAGGTVIAGAQAAVLLLVAPFIGLQPGVIGMIGAILAAGLTAAALVAMGLAAAWWIDSTAGFHGVMNMVLMPMWLLSGAIFPVQGSSAWLAGIVLCNPLQWCHAAMASSLGLPAAMGAGWAWLGTILFTAAMMVLAAGVMSARNRGLWRAMME